VRKPPLFLAFYFPNPTFPLKTLCVTSADKELDIPAIVVVGNQSAGKSSLLQAISGVGLKFVLRSLDLFRTIGIIPKEPPDMHQASYCDRCCTRSSQRSCFYAIGVRSSAASHHLTPTGRLNFICDSQILLARARFLLVLLSGALRSSNRCLCVHSAPFSTPIFHQLSSSGLMAPHRNRRHL
jgi:hypothetical protein